MSNKNLYSLQFYFSKPPFFNLNENEGKKQRWMKPKRVAANRSMSGKGMCLKLCYIFYDC